MANKRNCPRLSLSRHSLYASLAFSLSSRFRFDVNTKTQRPMEWQKIHMHIELIAEHCFTFVSNESLCFFMQLILRCNHEKSNGNRPNRIPMQCSIADMTLNVSFVNIRRIATWKIKWTAPVETDELKNKENNKIKTTLKLCNWKRIIESMNSSAPK